MRNQEHVFQTGESAYSQLTAYLTNNEKQELENKLQAVSYSNAENKMLAGKIQRGQWNELFVSPQCAEFPARALKCLRDGDITTMQYVTSQSFYNVFTHPDNSNRNVKLESIFNADGKLIKNSIEKIEATMKIISSSFKMYVTQLKNSAEQKLKTSSLSTEEYMTYNFLANIDIMNIEKIEKEGNTAWLSEREKNSFYRLLKTFPASENCFIILDDPYFDGKTLREETSVMQQINYRVGFNVFSRLRIDGKPKVMIPSAGMMQAFLQATRPKTRMPAVYRFGLSPIEGLFSTMESGGRDKIICTAILPDKIPTTADGFPANLFCSEAEQHDFYHEVRCADVPINDTHFIAELIKALPLFALGEDIFSSYLESFKEACIDMEFFLYYRSLSKYIFLKMYKEVEITDPKHLIWATLNSLSDISCGKCRTEILLRKGDSAVIDDVDRIAKTTLERMADEFQKWLLRNEASLYLELNIDLREMMQYKCAPNTLIGITQKLIRARLFEITKDKSIEELLEQLDPRKQKPTKQTSFMQFFTEQPGSGTRSKPGLLLIKHIKEQLEEQVPSDLANAIRVCYQRKSTLLLGMIHKNLAEYFSSQEKLHVIFNLQQQYPDEMSFVINEFRGTTYADTIIQAMLNKNRQNIKSSIIDLLYDPNLPDRVYASDKTTLLHRALAAEDIELMLRLTNDGACVAEVPGTGKPSPLAESSWHGRYDLMLMLSYAYHYGAGWTDNFPDIANEIRDNQSNKGWMSAVWRRKWLEFKQNSGIPDHVFQSEDDDQRWRKCEPSMRNAELFYSQMRRNKRTILSTETPEEKDFLKALTWAHDGGSYPC